MSILERYGYQPGTNTFCPAHTTRISDADIVDIANELAGARSITSLDLTNSNIGVEAAVALSKAIGRNTVMPLQHIRLADCNMRPDAVAALATAIAQSPKLEIVDFTSNYVRDEGCEFIAHMITSSTSLRVLTLAWCNVGPAGMRTLAAALNNSRLRQLELQGNKLRAAGCIALCGCLAKNTTISSLDVSANAINAEGGRAIAELLQVNTVIESLKAGTNYISDAAPHIALACSARALASSTAVMRLLDLSNNRIDAASCRAMAQTLEGKRFNASCLSFERNPCGDEGLVGLFHAIRGTAVQFLDLSECGLTHRSGVVIADLVLACKQLNSVQVDGNDLGDDALHEVLDAFGQSTTLCAMNLERTNMGARSVDELCNILRKRTAPLRSLNLAENANIDQASLERLLEALGARNVGLEELDLSDLPAAVVEDEHLLRLIVNLFVANPTLNKVLVERTPLAALLPPPGLITTSVASALLKAAAAAEQQQKSANRGKSVGVSAVIANASTVSSTHLKAVMTSPQAPVGLRGISSLSQRLSAEKSAMALVPAGRDTSSATSANASVLDSRRVGNTNPAAIYRPPWALTVPVDSTPNPYLAKDDDAEDGRYPPLVPLKGSLHDPMYPGYGKGALSNAVTLQSLNNPFPFSVRAAQQTKRPFIPTCDGASTVAVPPKKALKAPPYSLESLENNSCFLPISEDQLRRKFAELDVDGSGYLDRNEFKKLYLTFPNYGVPHNEKQVDDLFNKFAREDHRLDFDEFCVLMLHVATR